MRRVIGGPIALDPATDDGNPTKAVSFYTKEMDGLSMPWAASSIFLNPPWSRKENIDIKPWLRRAKEARESGGLHGTWHMFIVTSAAMNAAWVHDYLMDAHALFFPRGRIHYELPFDADLLDAPGFDSMVSYWGSARMAFYREFGDRGVVR